MATTNLAERDEYIVSDYKAGMDPGELQRTYGVSRRRILQILREAKVELRPRPRVSEMKPLSRVHDRVGRVLYDAMIDQGHNEFEAANALGWSLHKFKRVVKGLDDLRLLDLLDLVQYSKREIKEVIGRV